MTLTSKSVLDQQHAELLQRVFESLASSGRELRIKDKDGRQPIVVALEQDLLSEVLARVSVSGKAANVFVEMASGQIELILVHLGPAAAKRGKRAEDLGPEPIHKDITIGLMVDIARHHDDGVLAYVKLRNISGEIEYVDREGLVDA